MTSEEEKKLIKILNEKYDKLEDMDKQIDFMILTRNKLMDDIESGAAVLLKYGKKSIKRMNKNKKNNLYK